MKNIALIPARSGSTRLPNKNVKILAGHPLLAHTIHAALNANIFDRVFIITDSQEYVDIASKYGASCFAIRPTEISGTYSSDIEWLSWALDTSDYVRDSDNLFVLRPTSPLRGTGLILDAYDTFLSSYSDYDSLRCVSTVDKHPGKMWSLSGGLALPLLPFSFEGVPWHSCQTSVLPKLYVQNASLEIVKTSIVLEKRSLSGDRVLGYVKDGFEVLDVNTSLDFEYIEFLVASNRQSLPLD